MRHAMVAQSWDGYWWSPDTPDRKIKGVLEYTRSGRTLLILDNTLTLIEIPEAVENGTAAWTFPGSLMTVPAIYGLAGGEAITLAHCTGGGMFPTGFADSEQWDAKFIFSGAHITAPSEPVFTSASLSLDALPVFAQGNEVGYTVNTEQESGHLASIQVDAARTALGTADLPWGQVALVNAPLMRVAAGEVSVQMRTEFHLNFTEPCTWDDILRTKLRPLQDFIAVLQGRATYIDAVTVRTADHGSAGPIGVFFRPIEPLFRRDRKPDLFDFFLNRHQLPGGFETAIPAWFDIHQDKWKTIGAEMDAYYAPHSFKSDDLLDFVRGAQHLLGDPALAQSIASNAEQAFLDEVASLIPDSHHLHDKVFKRLTAKQAAITLREQIQALVAALGEAGTWLVGADIEDLGLPPLWLTPCLR